jgi:hypothetical protein
MKRKTKISLLSKLREQYFQNLPGDKGKKELRLLCDTISDRVIKESNPTYRKKVTNSKELQTWLQLELNLEVNETSIEQVRSWKKTLLIPNNKKYKIYKQKF